MYLFRLFAVGVLILLSAGFAFASGQRQGLAEPPAISINHQAKRHGVGATAKTADSAVSGDILDCSTYVSDGEPILPATQKTFQLGEDVSVPSDGADYISGIWSPKGDSIIFSVPDGGVKIENHDLASSDEPSSLLAVGTSSLFLYTLESRNSQQIASGARKPVWSSESDAIYYFDGNDLMKFALNARSASKTESSIPATGASMLFSRALPDGTLLAPRTPHGAFEIQESQDASLHELGLNENDQVHVSPSGDKIVVGYGANTFQGNFSPATTFLYDGKGNVSQLLENCQYSTANLVWSTAGDKVAYPVHTSYPEIRVYDLNSRSTNIVIRLADYTHLGGISWSPDDKFLLFTDIEKNVVWVIGVDGNFRQQILKNALMPKWSPDGGHILFARQDGESPSWHISQVIQK